jgi:general secretion pathway protein L
MAESLVLRYPLTGDSAVECEWVPVDPHGLRAGDPGRGTLAQAALACAGRRLVVLVPAEEVTLAAPELPTRSRARLQKLVPFALEEHLAAEIDGLHFAIGRPLEGGGVEVAAVEAARLRAWLEALAAVGLAPAALCADALALPDNPAHVVVLLEPGRLVVRRPGRRPLTLEATPLATALSVAGLPRPAGEDPGAPPHVLLYAAPADWAAAEPLVESLRGEFASLNVQLLADGALGLLAAGAVAQAPLSLLQGPFAPREGWQGQWPRWRLAASLVAALVVVHVAMLGVDGWRLHKQEVAIDQQLRALAVEALPDVQNPARLPSIRLAIEGRVRKSRAATTAGLLGTLGALGAAVGAAPGTQLQSLSYRDGATDLLVTAPDVGALDRLQEAARGRGYEAQLQGATQKDQRYEGRLQLKGPGP